MLLISTILILTGILAFLLSLIVLTAGARLLERVSFAFFAISMAVWSSGIGLFLSTGNAYVATWAAVAYYVAALTLLYGLLIFSYVFTRDDRLDRKQAALFVVLAGLPVLAMIYVVISPAGLIQGVTMTSMHTVILDQGKYSWFTALYIVYGLILLLMLFGASLRRITRQKRIQSAIIRGIIGVGLPGAAFFNLILPLFDNYSFVWVGPLFVLPTILLFFYVIMRHSLFDVRLAFVRTLAYALSLASLAAIYFALAYLVYDLVLQQSSTSGQAIANVVLALVLSFIFQPVKRFFDRITNTVFYRDSYNVTDFFARLASKLSAISDLDTLLHYSSVEISRTLKANFGAFYIYRDSHRPFFVSTELHMATLPNDDSEMLAHFALKHRYGVIITAALQDNPKTRQFYRMLVSHHIALVLPLFREETPLGYFFLGDHLSSQYTRTDIEALETIADELTISVENALSVQEVRDVNEHLQQRIDNATKELRHSNEQLIKLDEAKDDFISMASHQLRTPLTTIKGYISMVIEGDAGKITPAQKHLLGEAFNSSERMVRLIADFLNVSRLQTGKFMIEKIPTNLAKVVQQELDQLAPNAAARKIKFAYKRPRSFPVLDLDDTKIRQVIMNFADNALYYSNEDTTVTVTLKEDDGDVVLTVADQGIGIPKAQQSKLFEKFFRASNARTKRPDGTGVGLFLAKKVIDGHGGSIIFESIEGAGSTFGFRLPIKKLKVDEI